MIIQDFDHGLAIAINQLAPETYPLAIEVFYQRLCSVFPKCYQVVTGKLRLRMNYAGAFHQKHRVRKFLNDPLK